MCMLFSEACIRAPAVRLACRLHMPACMFSRLLWWAEATVFAACTAAGRC
jgi:hypothetical protein